MRAAALGLAAAIALAGPAAADSGAPPVRAAAEGAAVAPFPLDISAEFDLVDQTGARRRAEDFRGRPMLVFFGYAGCDAICDVALPAMAETLRLLGPDPALAAVMITVDPVHDTPAALAEAAPRVHPQLVALTGSERALAAARRAFGVTVEKVFAAPAGRPVYAHGSFVFLVGGDGRLMTVMPPILGPERMAEIVRRHLGGA